MSDPDYVALRTDLRDGSLVDFISGWSISGNEVKPFPTIPNQVTAVRSRLHFGILVESTEEEYETQNPVIIPPVEPVVLSSPTSVTAEVVLPDVWLIDPPLSTSLFIVDKLPEPEGSGPTVVFKLQKAINVRAAYSGVFLGFEALDEGINPYLVVTDGATMLDFETHAGAAPAYVIGAFPSNSEWHYGFRFTLISDGTRWVLIVGSFNENSLERILGDIPEGGLEGLASTVSGLSDTVQRTPPFGNPFTFTSGTASIPANSQSAGGDITDDVTLAPQNPGAGFYAEYPVRVYNDSGDIATVTYPDGGTSTSNINLAAAEAISGVLVVQGGAEAITAARFARTS